MINPSFLIFFYVFKKVLKKFDYLSKYKYYMNLICIHDKETGGTKVVPGQKMRNYFNNCDILIKLKVYIVYTISVPFYKS
jgi:hypothetical protein